MQEGEWGNVKGRCRLNEGDANICGAGGDRKLLCSPSQVLELDLNSPSASANMKRKRTSFL